MKKILLTSPLFTRIATYCQKHSLINPAETVIVGFSGGPDSLFLLHALTTIIPTDQIIAAHLDHGWRQESKKEAEWCATVAHTLNVRFVCEHFDSYAQKIKNRGSKEDSARQARRKFFANIATKFNAQKIALAHHADDQLETFFIRLIRGAGIQGLAAMRPRNNIYIRPLLELTKNEIIQFLSLQNINYITDPSNTSQDYLRNRIRQTVIPALADCDRRAEKKIQTIIAHLQEVDEYLEMQTHTTLAFLSNNDQKELCINTLKELHPLIRHRIFIQWLCNLGVPFTPSKNFFAEIERFLFQSQSSSSHHIAPGWIIHKQHNRACLTTINN